MPTTQTLYGSNLFVNETARDAAGIARLLRVVHERAQASQDYIAEPGAARFTLDGSDVWMDVKVRQGGITAIRQFAVRETAHEDIASQVRLCRKDYDALRTNDLDLWVEVVNRRMTRMERTVQFRFVGDHLTSVVSPAYMGFPFPAILAGTAPVMVEHEVVPIRFQLSERQMYLAMVGRNWPQSVRTVNGFTRVVDGSTQPLVTLGSSDIGEGALCVECGAFYQVCCNCNVWNNVLTRRHIGERAQEVGYISAATRAAKVKLVCSTVADAITETFDGKQFAAMVAAMTTAADTPVTVTPVEAVAILQDTYKLSDAEFDALLNEFALPAFGNSTPQHVLGIANAVTYVAQTVDNPDREIDLVRVGGSILRDGPTLFTPKAAEAALASRDRRLARVR